MSRIFFHYADKHLNLSGKRKIQSVVEAIFKMEGKGLCRVDYIFCSDEYLLRINQTNLQHDYYTDIITFELSETDETIGEIYISLDRVKDNSVQFDESYRREILRVIFHGALHLCGYKDKSVKDAALMRKMEEKYLDFYYRDEKV